MLYGIIFDLDGTLGNTLPVCFAAFRYAFDRFLGRRFTDEEISALFGPDEAGMIQRQVPEAWQECLEVFMEQYEKSHYLCPLPFQGIPEALQLTRRRGLRTAVVTGKGERSAAISMRYLGLSPLFDQVEYGAASGGVKQANIRRVLASWKVDPARVAYVGDVASDIRDAKQVGAIALAAAWAPTADTASLQAADPQAVFASVQDYVQWMEENTQKEPEL
jgi:pyrophosphatase PpaX